MLNPPNKPAINREQRSANLTNSGGTKGFGSEGNSQDSALSFGLKLTHCFMLMTWLFSVSRSIRAAVR
jgi:hypothetical protein